MANTFLNAGNGVVASSNPEANVNQVNNATPQVPQNNNGAISPITIPIQIQPQVATPTQPTIATNQNLQNLQTNQNTSKAPTPQAYNPANNNTQVVNFDQIYKSYQSAYGNNQTATNNNIGQSGIKKTSIGTTIVTPTTSNLNTVKGQYQSAYADTINGIISTMFTQLQSLQNGSFYDPTQDASLRVASEYAANSTLQSLAGSGVLNSTATAERVARIVSELIPQYEDKAYERQVAYLGQLANMAQVVMDYDSQQFAYWKDAKDREFQEKEFQFNKQQKELENAWKRVDELGYVDNKASKVLGVKVGTLSKDARERKEQQEFELKKIREQAKIEFENTKALYKIKSELETKQQKALIDYEYKAKKSYAKYESELTTKQQKTLAKYQSDLNIKETESKYKAAQKYSTTTTKSSSSGTKTKTTSESTYKSIIKNKWGSYNTKTRKYTVTNNDEVYNYLLDEYEAGRMTKTTLQNLVNLYSIHAPTKSSNKKTNTSSKSSSDTTKPIDLNALIKKYL